MDVRVLAHRGDVRGGAPENTLAAFAAAIEAGADGFETDLRATADGEIVLFHDRRLPDGRPVAALDRATLAAAAGHDVPTLEAALDAFPDAFWNLEVKDARVVPRLRDVLATRVRPGAPGRFLVTSFDHRAVRDLVLLGPPRGPGAPPFETGVLVDHAPLSATLPWDAWRLAGLDWLVAPVERLGTGLLLEARQAGFQVGAYDVADRAEATRLVAEGARILIADDVPAVR